MLCASAFQYRQTPDSVIILLSFAERIEPSSRGELEITALNTLYIEKGALNVETLGRGTARLDTGSHDSLLAASSFIPTIGHRQGLIICYHEEIACKKSFIGKEKLQAAIEKIGKSGYGAYLERILVDGKRA